MSWTRPLLFSLVVSRSEIAMSSQAVSGSLGLSDQLYKLVVPTLFSLSELPVETKTSGLGSSQSIPLPGLAPSGEVPFWVSLIPHVLTVLTCVANPLLKRSSHRHSRASMWSKLGALAFLVDLFDWPSFGHSNRELLTCLTQSLPTSSPFRMSVTTPHVYTPPILGHSELMYLLRIWRLLFEQM